VLAARLARVTSVYVQLRIVHLSGCETNVDFNEKLQYVDGRLKFKLTSAAGHQPGGR
jgi:hypothetical protein